MSVNRQDVQKKIYINCSLNCILMKRYKAFRLACMFALFHAVRQAILYADRSCFITLLLTLQSDQSLHMTHVICRILLCTGSILLVHWFLLRRVLQTKLSFSIFYQVCASGMVCGKVCGICKILYHTTYPTSVLYHFVPYALFMFCVV